MRDFNTTNTKTPYRDDDDDDVYEQFECECDEELCGRSNDDDDDDDDDDETLRQRGFYYPRAKAKRTSLFFFGTSV